jgi:hypothetical protein
MRLEIDPVRARALRRRIGMSAYRHERAHHISAALDAYELPIVEPG